MVGAQKPQPKILSKWLNALHRTLTYERNRTHLTHFSRKISVRTNYDLNTSPSTYFKLTTTRSIMSPKFEFNVKIEINENG